MTAAGIDWNALRRADLERRFRPHVEGEVRFDHASRVLYSTDASNYQIEPVGVIIPRTQADVVAAVSIAMEQRVPIVPRGGGTSLSGQSIGAGIVIDFRKYLHHIVETDVARRRVRVEPGVVLAQLNQHLAPLGLQFGPDVATIDRANLGGMIGNNSAGARSIKHGMTVDHVLSLDVLLTDGSKATFAELGAAELEALMHRPDRLGDIYRSTRRELERNEDAIRRRFPKILRRVSGYNLDRLLPPAPLNLAKLIVGSEGTLAVVTEATLNVVPLPRERGIATVHFPVLHDALRCLPAIFPSQPTAIELIDRMILDLARRNVEYRSRIDFVEGEPAALLMVEYSSDDGADVDRRLRELDEALIGSGAGAILKTRDRQQCERVWSIRKLAMPLLLSLPGARKPITFVEDTAVDPLRLPEFVARFKEILTRHGTDGSFYGHASVGCLHIRPLLDLRTAEGIRDMSSIAEAVADLVLEFGGSMSGEHGDGLCRSVFNRKLFGRRVYESFEIIKRAFDPDNLMNPGKIVNGPPITQDLRPDVGSNVYVPTAFSFDHDGGIAAVAQRCNGNALCRRVGVGVMCPSYMGTREEEHSPRGRANLLRATFEGRSSTAWSTPELDAALDLCLMCKACKTECPSSVDVAKMKAEYLHHRHQGRPATLLEKMLAQHARGAQLGARFAPLSNWLIRSFPMRWMLDVLVGIDRRRRLPPFARKTFVDWFAGHETECRVARGRVLLLADCFTNYHDPNVGRCATSLLESAGFQVHLATICCGRTMISKGFLDEARQTIQAGIERIAPFVEEGTPVLGLEPSCILTLADEWRDLVPGPATELIGSRVHLVETWLAQQQSNGAGSLPVPAADSGQVLLHGHCHQKAAGALAASVTAVRRLANVEPTVLDAGCCGMAGSFGYEKGHYDLSVAIAEQRLLPSLRAAPEATVLAPGFSCRSQIADLARRRALHPVEFLHQRTNRELLLKERPRP